jgi:tRNA-dihydrouridine synthase B
VRRLMLDHLQEHYALYGDYSGVRTARKHIGWYVRELPGGEAFRAEMNAIEDCALQLRAVSDYFEALASRMERIPAHRGAEAPGGSGRGEDDDENEEAAAAAH